MLHPLRLLAVLAAFDCVCSYSLRAPTYTPRACGASMAAVTMAADLEALGVAGLPLAKTVKGFRA